MCARAKSGEPPKLHHCYKNWEGSSTSMEKDIIVEGFRRSVEIHGVKYIRLIADGDSSTYKSILGAAPYGNQVVQKVECRNHVLRNYCGRLREIATQTRREHSVPAELKKLILQRAARLRRGVATAIKVRSSEEQLSLHQRTQNLEKDIRNGPSHVFGEHRSCSSYFCSGPKPGEINYVDRLRTCGLFAEVLTAMGRVASNASSLIHDVDNNVAEHVNSVVAKFVGGKRVDYSKKRSYTGRCFGAALAFNSPGRFHYKLHKAFCQKSPGKYTKTHVKLHEARLSATRKQRLSKQPRCKRALQKAVPSSRPGPDADYGPAAQQPDMEQKTLEIACETFVNSLVLSEEQRDELEIETRGQADSPRWKDERRKRLTASSFGRVCKMKPTTSCECTVACLLYTFVCTPAMQYGRDNEPKAIERLETDKGVNVKKCGLFVDREYPYLAATPDGLVGEDTVVEVKCPENSKDLTPLEGVQKKKIAFCEEVEIGGAKTGAIALKKSSNHWYQVQGQLHITGRTNCLFVVWTRKDISVEIITRDDEFWNNKMIKQLQKFYTFCLLPELVDPRRSRSMPIRDPDYIQNAKKKKAEANAKIKKKQTAPN
ncbi:unnamed protein product [Ixodes persulcatus]